MTLIDFDFERSTAKNVDHLITANFIDLLPITDNETARDHLEARLDDLLHRVDALDLIEHRRVTMVGPDSDVEIALRGVDVFLSEEIGNPSYSDLIGQALATLEYNARVQHEWKPGALVKAVDDTIAGRFAVDALVAETGDLPVLIVHLLRRAGRVTGGNFYAAPEVADLRDMSAKSIMAVASNPVLAPLFATVVADRLVTVEGR